MPSSSLATFVMVNFDILSFCFMHTFIGAFLTFGKLNIVDYAADGLSFGNNVYWICFDDDFSEKVTVHIVNQHSPFLVPYGLFTFLVQKFRSSSPFGIRYQFHLEVQLGHIDLLLNLFIIMPILVFFG